jgi:hypothetical protein
MNRRLLAASLSLLCFIGCQTAPVKYGEVSEGNWRAKALIKDNEQSRSYIVNLNFNVKKDERVRMDVTTTLGTGIASLIADQKEVRYALFESKRFYFGAPQAGVMRPILSVPFDPRWIQNLLFEIPMAEKSWTCDKDAHDVLLSCSDSVTGVKITWNGRQGARKTIVIEHPKATVQINVQNFRPKVEDRKNLFSLEPPDGYQKLRVR